MVTFRQYLIEATGTGNYVSIDVEPSTIIPMHIAPSTGTPVPMEKRHVTIIYSKESRVNPAEVKSWLTLHCVQTIVAEGVEFAAFDSIPKDGERDEKKATLVLKLKCNELVRIHEKLKDMGMAHSYPDFSPHVSVCYEVDQDECHKIVPALNSKLQSSPISVVLTRYHSDYICENWVKSLK
jgi:hypothetical protein